MLCDTLWCIWYDNVRDEINSTAHADVLTPQIIVIMSFSLWYYSILAMKCLVLSFWCDLVGYIDIVSYDMVSVCVYDRICTNEIPSSSYMHGCGLWYVASSGYIELAELTSVIESLGTTLTDEQARNIYTFIDLDGDGLVSREEFIMVYVTHFQYKNVDKKTKAKKMFALFDR